MQPFSFIAVGIGAVLAFSPLKAVAADPAPTLRAHRPPEKPQLHEIAQPVNAVPEASAASAPEFSPTAESVSPSAIQATPPAADVAPSPAVADPSAAPAQTPAQTPAESNPAPADAQTEAVPPATPPATPAATNGAIEPAPEYLDPSPNPLLTPTQATEVEIVGTQPITLRQALELAQRDSQALQTAQQQLNRTRAALRQAEAANEPTANIGAGFQVQGNDQGAINQQTGVQTSGVNLNPVLSGTAQLSYDIFTSGQRSATISAAQQQVRFQELQLETTAEDLRLNVTIDYYGVQDADEQVRIAQSALAQSLRSLQDTLAQERAGIGTRFDVLQSQVQVANDQQQLTQQLSRQRIARRQLIQRLNLSEVVDISAAEPVAVADLWNLSLEDSIVLAYRNRAELEQQLVQRQIGDFQRRAAQAQLGPQVTATASYSTNNNLDAGRGFNNTFALGAQVNLQLFDGGASRAAAQQQEANIAAAESQFADLRSQVRFQVEQAFYNLRANFDNIQTASLAQEQAAESLRLARLRFQAGVGIQSDVLRAQTELTRAEVNRVEAILGYNRSLAQIQRAVSNFPDGNLADTP